MLLAEAAATAACDNADQDDSAEHTQGNDESFKVQPTHSPTGLGQRAQ